MKMLNRLILFFGILILPLTVLSGNLNTDTDTIPNSRGFSFDILPEINRDLKICDLVKEQNHLLTGKVAILENNYNQERSEKLAAQKEAKKERRKRKWSHIGRTVLEVGVLVAIIIL